MLLIQKSPTKNLTISEQFTAMKKQSFFITRVNSLSRARSRKLIGFLTGLLDKTLGQRIGQLRNIQGAKHAS
jgi:hypothetical protein